MVKLKSADNCSKHKIITLTTDFGNSFYTGIMKGVILKTAPFAVVEDITHYISKFNIQEACFVLENSCFYFPENTVHVAVVDPGVGSERKPLVIKTKKYFFVGPDNGIFSFVNLDDIENIFKIKTELENISNTFHGRDIFAPAAAKIVADVPFNDFLNRISLKETVTFGDVKSFDFEKNIIYIDEFGNIVLGIKHNAFLDKIKNMKWELNYKNLKFTKLNSNYFSVQKGDFLLLVNSLGYLEIACREDNAAEKLKAFVGDEFFIRVYR